MSRAPGKYVAGTMAPAGAALDRPVLRRIKTCGGEVLSSGSETARSDATIYFCGVISKCRVWAYRTDDQLTLTQNSGLMKLPI
jgi:hypothetical protein